MLPDFNPDQLKSAVCDCGYPATPCTGRAPCVKRIEDCVETITVTVRLDDAMVLVLGPLDAALQKQSGSVKRLRLAVARALGYQVETDESQLDRTEDR